MGSALEVGKACEDLAGRHGALAEDPGLAGREVDDGRGRPGQLAAVHDRGDAVADRGGHVLDPPRVGSPGQVGARRDEHPERGEDVAAGAWDGRDAGADRIGAALR